MPSLQQSDLFELGPTNSNGVSTLTTCSLQQELAAFQKTLLFSLQEVLAIHNEKLLVEVSKQIQGGSNAGSVGATVARNLPAAEGQPEVNQASSTRKKHNAGNFEVQDDLFDDDGKPADPAVLEGVQLKVDGAFGSIFNSAMDEGCLDEPHYHVENFYSETGWAQALARSDRFTNFTLGVIAFNAVWIGVDADWNDAETLYQATWPFIIADNAFAFFFSFELAVRFLAFQRKRDCILDGWFKFDTFLVVLMVVETWMMAPIVALMASGSGPGVPVQPLRLLRLLRLTRMARLMRALPELVTMCKGMKVASRAVCSSLLMVTILIYTFAIVLNMFLKEEKEVNAATAPRNFETITSTMWTLLMDGTFMDSSGNVLTTLLWTGKPVCVGSCFLFMTFILMSCITVMNMLIGVLCEVVSAVAQAEKDDAAIRLAKETILVNLQKFDDGDGLITKPELQGVMRDPQSKAVLASLNIDRLFFLELQQMLFKEDGDSVPIKTIMELMLMCRGDLPVSVQHMASTQALLIWLLDQFEGRLTSMLLPDTNGA
jgi:hypothetical protein